MALHEVQLKGYSVRPGNLSLGTFDSYGIEQLHVTLDDTWSGLAVTATFNPPDGEPVEIRVPENGLVDVPAEATANAGTGTIVYCGVANGVQRISKTQGYNVITHGNVGTTVPFNPSESLATQVLQAALNAEKNSAEAKSAAASAVTAAANSASAAKTSEDAAAASEDNARISAGAAAVSEGNAAASAGKAKASENAAAGSASNAAASEKAAAASAVAAAGSAAQAETQKTAAAKSANDAQGYMQTASGAATAANASAENAAASKAAATSSATAAVGSATAAAGDAKTASDAAAGATDAKAAAVAAQKDAAASKAAAANSAIAAKTSEDAAANSAADADRTANSINASMAQIAANKEAIGKLKDGKISKFYASSQGDTNLPDSDAGQIVDFKLYGKSEQKQYSGKNLLDLRSGLGGTGDGITYTPNGDGSYTRKGTATGANGNVWFLGAYGGTTPLFTLKAGTYTIKDCTFFNGTNIFDDTFTAEDDLPITGVRNLWQGTGESYDDVVYPRLLAGSTDTGWEPYVGGIPSPNPEYPQEIKSVVKPKVKVCGKNLFDNINKSIDDDGWTTTKIVYVPKGKYVYKRFVDASSNGEINTQLYALIDGLWKSISNDSTTSFDDGNITFIDGNWNMGWGTTSRVIFELKKGYYMRASNPSDEVHLMLVSGDTEPTEYEECKETTATLPYTLNAIPVRSGGNVTIDGQQYVADYVDVERGKLVRMVDSSKLDTSQSIIDKTDWLLATPTETDLTADEIAAFKSLVSYYPVTNVSTTSDQLDGYTVFNYPISLANGWNYVKQQLGDTRDYLYGIDLMTAEAYVNSEYAAALAEIEV